MTRSQALDPGKYDEMARCVNGALAASVATSAPVGADDLRAVCARYLDIIGDVTANSVQGHEAARQGLAAAEDLLMNRSVMPGCGWRELGDVKQIACCILSGMFGPAIAAMAADLEPEDLSL